MLPYRDRVEAGRLLAAALERYKGRDVIVLALPRGGVPVGYEVAGALGAPLDVIVARKLGLPMQPELAVGAIASGGAATLNPHVAPYVSDDELRAIARREVAEIERRERHYRGDRPRPRLEGRTVILVDDGLATGATMRAAVAAVRAEAPETVVVAVPVAPAQTLAVLREEAGDVVCPETPPQFFAIGQFYRDFDQVSDDEVAALLAHARDRAAQATAVASEPRTP